MFFSLFSRGHHCSASYGLRAVDPHHVVRYLVLLLVNNSHTKSSLHESHVAKREHNVAARRLYTGFDVT